MGTTARLARGADGLPAGAVTTSVRPPTTPDRDSGRPTSDLLTSAG